MFPRLAAYLDRFLESPDPTPAADGVGLVRMLGDAIRDYQTQRGADVR